MQIAIDARYLGMHSALARYSESVLLALARIDTRNEYVVYVNAKLKRRLKLGENFEIIPIRGNPASLGAMQRLTRALRRLQPDLLHAHYPLAPLFVDCPMLLTVHDVLPFSRDPLHTSLRHKPLRWLSAYALYPLSLRKADWILCVSQTTRTALGKLFPEFYQKTIAVRSGVEDAFEEPVAKATRELVRARLELPEQYLFYSGSARADKNLTSLVRVFARLRERNPDAFGELHLLLEIYSGGDDLPAVDRLVQQLRLSDYVRVLQDVGLEERRVLHGGARAFCIFSRFEGFGVPVLEAQLSSVPVVAADRGALPEIAGEQGAVYVDPERLEETVGVLERVLTEESLRSYLIEEGLANARRYNWETTAGMMRQIYELVFHPRAIISDSSPRSLGAQFSEWFKL